MMMIPTFQVSTQRMLFHENGSIKHTICSIPYAAYLVFDGVKYAESDESDDEVRFRDLQ